MPEPLSPQDLPRLPTPIPPTTQSTPTTTTSARWCAVATRDPTAKFIYGVKTTKIYCRPSCSARLARRANVEFYDTPGQAERAGFRACKRCKPETLEAVVDRRALMVQRACQMIEEVVCESRNGCGSGSGSDSKSKRSRSRSKPTLAELARDVGLTPCHFHRVFRKVMGVTPGAYAAGVFGKVASHVRDVGGQSVGDSGSESRNGLEGKDGLFQPCEEAPCAGLDAGLLDELDWDAAGGPGGVFGAGVNNTPLWNDFDVLIAAEAEYMACQGMRPLPRAPILSDSIS